VKKLAWSLAAPLGALAFTVIVASIALLLSGNSPFTTFNLMWTTTHSARAVVSILNNFTSYYIAGLAVAIGFKMGLFNIGADGQYRLAVVIAAYLGAQYSVWAPIHVASIIAIAMAVGVVWAAIPAILKVTRGVNEVVATIMLNSIATGISAYLMANHFRVKSDQITKTKLLARSAWIPNLNELLAKIGYHLPKNVHLNGFLIVSLLVGFGYYLLVWRTRFGFDLRSTGINPFAARSAGVHPNAMIVKTMLLSGAIAALIGMGPLLGDGNYHQYSDTFPTGLAFTGIALALIGRNSPIGVAVGAMLWSFLEVSTQSLSLHGIPQEIAQIMQGAMVVGVVVAYEVVTRWRLRAIAREAAERTESTPSPSLAVTA
jgi:simple sugar transport system permease protein